MAGFSLIINELQASCYHNGLTAASFGLTKRHCLTTTYAGFTGESELLESLYKQAMNGETIAPDLYAIPGHMLCYWTHECRAPWQTPEWVEQMRAQLRPNAFLRLIENRWVSSESGFVDMADWDACVDAELRPVVAQKDLPVWVGVDASIKRDSSAIAVCAWENNRVRLVWHRIFQPKPSEPLDFEETIEKSLLWLRDNFHVRAVYFDPYQMAAVSQRLARAGLPMREFPQTVGNLTEASSNLYELIRGRNLAVYADADIRLSVSRCIAVETSRGWRIAKEKASHKIDVVVALAQAALAAVRGHVTPVDLGDVFVAEDERLEVFFTGYVGGSADYPSPWQFH